MSYRRNSSLSWALPLTLGVAGLAVAIYMTQKKSSADVSAVKSRHMPPVVPKADIHGSSRTQAGMLAGAII